MKLHLAFGAQTWSEAVSEDPLQHSARSQVKERRVQGTECQVGTSAKSQQRCLPAGQ